MGWRDNQEVGLPTPEKTIGPLPPYQLLVIQNSEMLGEVPVFLRIKEPVHSNRSSLAWKALLRQS